MLIYRAATQEVELIESTGFWTGFLPDVSDLTTGLGFALAPGDVLLLYTDGVLEAKDRKGEQFELERLSAALKRSAGLAAEAIAISLIAEVNAWLAEQLDDMSLIVLSRLPEGNLLPRALTAGEARE
jgi:sigma-B regulation protein RsbU (phosphoserine phosphatase)